MRNVKVVILIALSTGCNSVESVSTSQSASSTSVEVSSASVATTTGGTVAQPQSSPTPTPNQFLYVLVAGKVCAFPLDNSSKDLIQPEYGSWCVGATSGNFFSMVIDPSNNYLYASSSAQSKIYQYAINQSVYQTYGSSIPLTALTTPTFATNNASSYMSFGSNGNLYIQNYNYSPARLDKLNKTNGLLSFASTVVASGETTTYGMTFAHITSVTSGVHTYVIDSGANRIVHYNDGVLSQSFQLIIAGTLNAIAIK